MKLSWKDAPEWAKFVAMDEDGVWYWYEFEPTRRYGNQWGTSGGKYTKCFPDWDDSLEERPISL